MKILNFGSCNIDRVYNVRRIVQAGETICANSLEIFPGGKGLNQSVAMARAGLKVYHAGCIGTDGEFLREILNNAGADTGYLKSVNYENGHAVIQVDENGENSIVLHNGSNYMITEKLIDEVLEDFSKDDILVIQNEISNIFYLIQKAYEKGMKIIFNPSPFSAELKATDLSKIFIIMVNQVEGMEFSGSKEPERIIEYFTHNYPGLRVVLTLGSKGSIYADGQGSVYCPSYCVKAVDTTSAGDTFTGYFISSFLKGASTAESLRLASAAAALAVSKKGASSSIPMRDEVTNALKILKQNESDITADTERRKEAVLKYIDENPAQADAEEISRLLGYSRPYAGIWIKKHMGETFSSILQKRRCAFAARLLRETDLPIMEIIARTGYKNESFFRKAFYDIYGKSLLEYRKFYSGNTSEK